ncbi:unnamed protein product [Mesocestoides corti]|uniref:Uncharacterized protein n=1 Tax=Mesocestoides corti TaxID=53468 RepID=A0A0R3U5V5_MESCO|nr:unnamed protein product [Mesocestoides corti]
MDVGCENSLTQIEIILDPRSFSDELSLLDHMPTCWEFNILRTSCSGRSGGGGGPNPSTKAVTQPSPQASFFLPPNPNLPKPANQLPTMPEPAPPPCLSIRERLELVERWINSIPPDAFTDEQTSPTKTEITSDSKSSANKLFISNHKPTLGGTIIPSTIGGSGSGRISKRRADYDYHVQQQHQLWSQGVRTSRGGGGGDQNAGVAVRRNTTTALGGNRLLPQSTPGGSNHQSPALARPAPSFSSAHSYRFRERSSIGGASNRAFNDYETQLVVDLFRDILVKGNYPTMGEVRQRTTNSELRASRSVKGIWKKAKQLHANGRWKEYAPP